MSNSSLSPTINLIDDDDNLNDGETTLLDGFIDLTLDSDKESDSEAISVDNRDDESAENQQRHRSASKRAIRKQETRNGPIAYPFETVDHWPQFELKPGKTVELKGKDRKDGDFVRIQDIILNPTKDFNNILLRGRLLRRAKYVGSFTGSARVGGQTVGGKMKRDLNELALLFQVDKDDPRPPEEQSLVTVSLSEVLCLRHVIFTHEEFPIRSFRETTILNRHDPDHEFMKQSVKETGVLVCRYAFTEYFEDAQDRLSPRKCTEASLMRIFMKDSDFPSGQPISSHNGTRSNQGHATGWIKRARHHDGPVKKRNITYGSGCCGAGGDCLGAQWGGAQVKYGWDHNESACQSARRNHPHATIYCREAEDFPRYGEDDHCDILHLSWPCDYFSPNHTHEGKNDDANISALFGTYEKLRSANPRIHTQENTFGIHSHHPEFLGLLIQEIIRAGYNIRWKVDQFADHGSPASRKRLILLASKIGVPLPQFPKATHGPPGSGLARYRTVHNAIAKISANASWHHNYQSPYAVPKPQYDPHTAKSSCVTRDGGKHPHPSGKRPFTPREMANLQGFPEHYEFKGGGITEVKTQIGNAIPPNVWKHYIKSCVTTLENFDAGLIDETGRPINHTVIKAETEASKGSTTLFNRLTESAKASTMHSARTSTFSTPPARNNFSTPSNSTQRFLASASTSSSQSSFLGSTYLLNPSPAPCPSRAWSEESRTLSPELSSLSRRPSVFKQEIAPVRTRSSPFKRKYQAIDLTDDKQMKKGAYFDLTDDDWVMVDDI